jgi:hypothetical protein
MTAVQWLISQLNKKGFAQVVTDEEIEQADKMFEQQIILANRSAYGKPANTPNMRALHKIFDKQAQEYYNETYKNKINLVEIPQEQLEKERNPNYKYFSIDEPKTSQLPGVNVNDVKPSNPQMVKENFSPQVDKQRMYSEEQLKLAYMQGYNRGELGTRHDMESYIEFIKQTKKD